VADVGRRVIELRDVRAGLDAVVVIDHGLFPISAGGTRMVADVTVEEVARLARVMTWKFAACRVPCAGAKAGIRWNGDGDRAAVLAAYRRKLEPFAEEFLTGPDLGTDPSDYLDEGSENDLPLWAQTHQGLGMDDLATGHGVKAAAEVALESLGRSLAGATVAIEGFGKVGAGTAHACARAGALVVGVSTAEGLVADARGLDVEKLIGLREEHGDAFVAHASARVRPREELFELTCDVLVPGARPDSVSRQVAERVACAVVAPGANAPYGRNAPEVLHARGIVALPDFVTNSGGVHLYEHVADLAPDAALERIEELVGGSTARLLAAADEARTTPVAAALADAQSWLAEQFPSERSVVAELF
jgi:glutamate dehydrogenase (NAD(P)+)